MNLTPNIVPQKQPGQCDERHEERDPEAEELPPPDPILDELREIAILARRQGGGWLHAETLYASRLLEHSEGSIPIEHYACYMRERQLQDDYEDSMRELRGEEADD